MKKNIVSTSQFWNFVIFTIFTLILIEPAYAQDAPSLSGMVCGVMNFFQGTFVKVLAVIGLVIIGLLAVFGMWDIRRAGFWALGIIIIFSAPTIVGLISGGGGAFTCETSLQLNNL